MTRTVTPPACPIGLASVADAALADALSAAEMGAMVRLVAHAWAQQPPCTVEDSETSLAMVARVSLEDWRRMRPRLLLTLGATQAPPPATAGGTPGRITLGHARRVYETLATRATSTSAARRSAGLAGANARWHADGKCHANDGKCHAFAIAAPPLRSESSLSSPSLSLTRPKSADEYPEREEPKSIVALLGDGARAILEQKLAEWRRVRSLEILQRAIVRWSAAGYTTCPATKASQLASSRHATPARVETIVENADAGIAAGRVHSPVGIVIAGLGESARSRGVPAEVPLFVAERWARLEASAVRMMEAQAAVNARLAQASAAISPAARGGAS